MFLFLSCNRDGYVIKEDSRGNLISILHYKNNKLDGNATFYHENGRIESIVQYKEYSNHGSWVKYYENGKIMSICKYENGLLNGNYFSFFDNGKISKFEKYIKDNINSSSYEWYESGNLKEYRNWCFNSPCGKQVYFYDNKKKKSIMHYNEGAKKVGYFCNWYYNGNKEIEGYYDSSGKETGTWIIYNVDGTINNKIKH
jgi:antitoxin component YwqK of YwqJK toxin-antitoxin module